MRKIFTILPVVGLVALTGCNGGALTAVQTDANAVSATIAAACGGVMAAAAAAAPFSAVPQIASLEQFATASCGTAEAISGIAAKAVSDPSTAAWLANLQTSLKAAKAAVAK